MNSSVPEHPLLEGLLGRPEDRVVAVKVPGRFTPWDAPWGDAAREADKTRLYRYVLNTPEGTPLAKVVTDVFGDESGDYSNTDYQLARRFFERHDCFLIARRGGNLWAEPTPDAFHLTRCKHPAKRQDGVGSTLSAGEGRGEYAKDRARSLLSRVRSIGSDSTRASLLKSPGRELASVEDRYTVLERVRGSGPEYLLAPYTNRFNSEERAREVQAKFGDAWDRTTEEFESAVCVTLTTDPGMHDSIRDATEVLLENKNRLAGWLAYDPKGDSRPSRPGRRPTNIYALEFTDSGLPHLHVVYFGVRWLTTHAALSRYWGERQGEVVWFDRMVNRNGRWRWAGTGPKDGEGRTPRRYLAKSLYTLEDLAARSPEEVLEEAGGDGEGTAPPDLWKMALYWATGKHFWGASPTLKETDGGDSLPHVPCYRFVGVARYGHLPGHVRRNGQIITQRGAKGPPPPDGVGSTGASVAGRSAG